MTSPPSYPPDMRGRGGGGRLEVTQSSFQGPLPRPEHLEHYDKILPGAAERILKMAESQAGHRQGLEAWVVRTGALTSILGVCFGLWIALAALRFAADMLVKGYPIQGVIVTLSTIGTLAGVFVYGRREAGRERDRRKESGHPDS